MKVKSSFRGSITKFESSGMSKNDVLRQCRILDGHDPDTGKRLIKKRNENENKKP